MREEDPVSRWATHMRRAVALHSEKEYLSALELVPELPEKRQYLVKTLRGLAGIYTEEGRFEDALPLFERMAAEAASPTKIFWCDYVRLLFRAAERRLIEKRAAAASTALELIRHLAEKAPGHPEMAALCREGYLQIGVLFEQAGAFVPAELYLERALEIAPHPGSEDNLQVVSQLAWKAFRRRDGRRADAWIRRALEFGPHGLSPKLGSPRARIARMLGALGAAAAQAHEGRLGDHYFSWGEKILREAEPDGSLELADLLVSWASCAATPRLAEKRYQEALRLREKLLGPRHAKTRELEAALGLDADSGFKQGFEYDAKPEAPQVRAFTGLRAATPQEIKTLFRRLVRLAHPDQAQSPEEFEARNRLMGEINAAAKEGDSVRLARLATRTKADLKKNGWLRET